MIFVTHALPANEPTEPVLSRDNVWDGLVLKAGNRLTGVRAGHDRLAGAAAYSAVSSSSVSRMTAGSVRA